MNPRDKDPFEDYLFNLDFKSLKPRFEVGDKVIVIKQGCKLSNRIVEIVRVKEFSSYYTYDVKAYGSNEKSTYSECSLAMYFESNGLGLTILKDRKEENKMEKLTGFNKIAMITIGYKDYAYALYDDTIKVGDTVIVTGMADDKILTIKDIVNVTDNTNIDRVTAEVKAKVDLTDYNNRVEKRQRKAELVRKMDRAIAEAKEVDKYAEYAKFLGDDFAKMFEEFKTL